ncbi:hypothetical protein TNCV_4246681 [Trichonephila clavipes]|nr:hypothetical protein TNCV_4246681 [Trichonephila clavipes]
METVGGVRGGEKDLGWRDAFSVLLNGVHQFKFANSEYIRLNLSRLARRMLSEPAGSQDRELSRLIWDTVFPPAVN